MRAFGRFAHPRCVLSLLVLLCCAGIWGADDGFSQESATPTAAPWDWPETEVREALSYIRLAPNDLGLRDDYVRRDGCRLALVDSMMRAPWTMGAQLQSFADKLFEPNGDSDHNAGNLVSMAFAPIVQTCFGTPSGKIASLPDADTLFLQTANLPGLAPAWREFLALTVTACAEQHWDDSVLSGLGIEARELVLHELPRLVLEDVADKDKSELELDAVQEAEDALAARFAELADSIRWSWVVARGTAVVDNLLRAIPETEPFSAGATAGEMVFFETPSGRGVIGTHGNDLYIGDFAIIIDPGGDDYYRLTPRGIGRPQMILDWSGDDTYAAPEGHGLGAGFWSWGILVDRSGNDTYRSGSFSQGAGWFGVGVLLDLDGRDIYLGDTHVQGAGGFGAGLLFDAGTGTDQYTARLFAQGFGFASGLGCLADAGGNDSYNAGGMYEDILRYRDHHLSLSQGFGYGIRPHFSGGVGLLLDAGGNDVYVADIFGQGCSYWWAFGGLYDGGGNDQYIAFQYAQGSATHLTTGCLLDAGGDDVYFAKGVSQGCGHDWAAGFLLDAAGNDRYTATDLSQAAGSANGVGVLIDGGGNDAYSVESAHNTQGYGNPRREYGSVGLFLDLGGTDRYIGAGRDSTIWLGKSLWGVGVDADSLWLIGERK